MDVDTLQHSRSSQLPFELYSQIIRYLSTPTLLLTARVCREFQRESEPTIYHTIEINEAWLRTGRFEALKRALLSVPGRQALVKEVHYKFMSWGDSIKPWADTFSFCLSTLPNMTSIIVPWFSTHKPGPNVWLDTKSRFEVVRVHNVGNQDRILEFYLIQQNIRQLSVVSLVNPIHPDVTRVLPNLTSLAGGHDAIKVYAPRHPITKVSLSWLTSAQVLEREILPALHQGTAAITHFRCAVSILDRRDLEVIGDGLRSLKLLEIIDSGDYPIPNQPTMKEIMAQGLMEIYHALSFENVRTSEAKRGVNEYPCFTQLFVNTLFGPLSRLGALQIFRFLYSEAMPEDNFTVFDLSKALQWRDTATPCLKYLRLNHVSLIKDEDGAWTQKKTTDWSMPGYAEPFPWRN